MSTAVPPLPVVTVHARRARRWLVISLWCLSVLMAGATPALAQLRDSEGAEEQARFKWGPLSLNPSVTVPYIGTDSNVFNAPEDPVRDFTFVVAPTADYWLRVRRLRLSAQSVVIGEYFQDTENQRSFGGEQAAKLEFGLDRFAPYIEGRYLNSRARPGLEVDLRARRREGRATLGLSLRLSERLEVDVSGGFNRVDHDEAEYFGVDLSEAFNRDGSDGRVRVRYELTPLTTFVVRTEVTRDRFVSSDFRDSEAIRILPGFEFSPSALLSGSAFVGVAQLKTLGSDVRDFAGVIAEIGVGYTGGANRYGLRVRRGPVYSFEPEEPFYVDSGLDVTVTRRMNPRWDAVGRFGHSWLDYDSSERGNDTASNAGGGVGYYLRPYLRVGLEANYFVRDSAFFQRTYDGLRWGATVSYGIQP